MSLAGAGIANNINCWAHLLLRSRSCSQSRTAINRAHKWDLNPDPRKGSQAAAEEEMDHQGPSEKGPSPVPFIPGWVVVGKLKQKTKR